jgi:hypothetical protein
MPRLFTLDEANALLPRLREVLPEMQEKKAALDKLRGELEEETRQAKGNGHVLEEPVREKRSAAQELADRLNELLAELQEMGCELKGLDQGLIDFPAQREGRVVYLCWRLGEERIAYWHDIDAGFAGRQPL